MGSWSSYTSTTRQALYQRVGWYPRLGFPHQDCMWEAEKQLLRMGVSTARSPGWTLRQPPPPLLAVIPTPASFYQRAAAQSVTVNFCVCFLVFSLFGGVLLLAEHVGHESSRAQIRGWWNFPSLVNDDESVAVHFQTALILEPPCLLFWC